MQDKSYFPILVEWQDTKEKEVITHPEFLEHGRGFKVIETNTKEKNK